MGLNVIRETRNYIVTVEQLPEDKLSQYVVRHKKYNVVEFADNTLLRVHQWVDECERLTEKYEKDATLEEGEPSSGSIVRNLN